LARVHISVRKAKQYQIIMRIVAYSGWVLAAALAAAPVIAQDAPQADSEIIVAREQMVDIGAAGEVAMGTPRTIMTLFVAPDTAPPEMTRIDRAYLAAFYRLRNNAAAIEVLLAAARPIAGESTRRR
jgi:hypothetical protein